MANSWDSSLLAHSEGLENSCSKPFCHFCGTQSYPCSFLNDFDSDFHRISSEAIPSAIILQPSALPRLPLRKPNLYAYEISRNYESKELRIHGSASVSPYYPSHPCYLCSLKPFCHFCHFCGTQSYPCTFLNDFDSDFCLISSEAIPSVFKTYTRPSNLQS